MGKRQLWPDVALGLAAGPVVFVGMILLARILRTLIEPWPSPMPRYALLALLGMSAVAAGTFLGAWRPHGSGATSLTAGATAATLLALLRLTFDERASPNPLVYGWPGSLVALLGALSGGGFGRWLRGRLRVGHVTIALGLLAAGPWGVLWIAPGGLAKTVTWHLLPTLLPWIGLVGAVVLWKAKPGGRPTRALRTLGTGLCALLLWPMAWSAGFLRMAYPASIERLEPHVWVRLPADEPLTVAWGGDRLATNYHAASPDQRWAYDLTVAPHFTGSPDLTDYGCWGVEVLAPANGLVVVAHDGEPDRPPGPPPPTLQAPFGNFVALRLEQTGTHLILAHLQQGSLQVQEGLRVREGQVIGRCGNSGRSSEPHIHIHHQRESPLERPVGFAEGLPLFFRDHDGPAMPEGGFVQADGEWLPAGPTLRHQGD